MSWHREPVSVAWGILPFAVAPLRQLAAIGLLRGPGNCPTAMTAPWSSIGGKVRQARYEATQAERRYLAVDAEKQLVARGLESVREKGESC